MIAVHESLNPKLINEYDNPFELLIVEVKMEHKSVRIMSGVGPQENWDETRRTPFFIALEAEVIKAQIAGKSVLIEIDANSKHGPGYIPRDPHIMSPNGRMLANIIENHALIVANGSSKCSG